MLRVLTPDRVLAAIEPATPIELQRDLAAAHTEVNPASTTPTCWRSFCGGYTRSHRAIVCRTARMQITAGVPKSAPAQSRILGAEPAVGGVRDAVAFGGLLLLSGRAADVLGRSVV